MLLLYKAEGSCRFINMTQLRHLFTTFLRHLFDISEGIFLIFVVFLSFIFSMCSFVHFYHRCPCTGRRCSFIFSGGGMMLYIFFGGTYLLKAATATCFPEIVADLSATSAARRSSSWNHHLCVIPFMPSSSSCSDPYQSTERVSTTPGMRRGFVYREPPLQSINLRRSFEESSIFRSIHHKHILLVHGVEQSNPSLEGEVMFVIVRNMASPCSNDQG